MTDAVETTTTGETGGESASATPDVDAASLAAARAAMGTEAPADTEAAAPVADEPAPAAAASAPAPAEAAQMTELEKLRKEIAGRAEEQKQRERLEAQYSAKLSEQLAAAREEIRKEEAAKVADDYRNRFKLKPVDAIKDLGIDGAQFVSSLAERAAGGPLYDELAAVKAQLAELATKGTTANEDRIKALEAERAQRIEAEQQYIRQQEERTISGMVTEKAPAVRAFFRDDATVVKRARDIANEYCQAKQVATCPYDVIVQQLQSEAKQGAVERLKALDDERAALSTLLQQPGAATGKPTESSGQRTGPRTLSAQGASERRASPKPPADMTEAERDEAMRAAAREAMGPRKQTRMA